VINGRTHTQYVALKRCRSSASIRSVRVSAMMSISINPKADPGHVLPPKGKVDDYRRWLFRASSNQRTLLTMRSSPSSTSNTSLHEARGSQTYSTGRTRACFCAGVPALTNRPSRHDRAIRQTF
jgi:hypothetical protein